MFDDLPELGAGLGYRMPLHEQTMAADDEIDFLEIISDQYLYAAPDKMDRLLALRERFPLIPHGVGLSIGTDVLPDPNYLSRLATLVERTGAPWFSDHLSFTRTPETNIDQLTPLWFTEESLRIVCRNVKEVTSRIDASFLLENITYYAELPGGEMSEAEFTSRVLEETGAGLLLDVNNVWVNSVNLGFDPYEFLDAIPLERTVQIHIAGGKEIGGMLVDTHSEPVDEEVWKLLDHVLDRAPVKAVLLEWDQGWPEFGEIVEHVRRARDLMRRERPVRGGACA
ncbi:DUF692 domain-containing protein [Nonomuraea sp. NPDC001636]|uniref:DUF692 domain-containing protein n=1 Tax=Nonomuraea sp. NPDC001636 TaxID=3154391 RepID=UPI0033216B81